MLIVSYDISDDKLRTKFSKYLSRFGYRLQYSVFKVKNSERVRNNIIAEIEGEYSKKFSQTDSVILFSMSRQCKVRCYGYAENEEKGFIIVA